MKISHRHTYSELYGPTVGDSIRLGDTNLWVTPESDYTIPGEEVTFGGGKVIRDGMGQSQAKDLECMDLVITNALILDYSAIVKADVGVKHGRIAVIGKARIPIFRMVTVVIGPGNRGDSRVRENLNGGRH